MACSLIAVITDHSNGKLSVQLEFIGACFPLVVFYTDHVALCESNPSFGIYEKDRVSPETTEG